ncbi:hypothetical protein OG875_02025 [Streptomyces sp. NBC_01498]|uniref:hypothetical protein n=1 Tax=Streptomyces sp. NBC_01498 TaxID=2975870 RepID=UPI002E7B4390|nr:hypothetical protein [Streptomyces sp. NBC_01498]WTL23482.1 hypothetical protein OG875_02025 [Streptomyces sp. NBC_01498]
MRDVGDSTDVAVRRATEEGRAVSGGPWVTLPGQKRVLVLVHTEVYGRRLRDLLPLLESDLRIEVVFTVAPHAFNDGAARFLRELGATVLPWQDAVRTAFDLVLAAGSRGMEQVRGPLVRISHGAGHMSLERVSHGSEGGSVTDGVRGPAGITGPGYLTWNGVVVPRAVALPHHDDLAALRRWCPQALPVAEVVGDPAYDRIAASLPLRERYRAALGLRTDEHLVLATMTWGRRSSFGQLDSLLPRLLTELPGRRFRTALLVHPNVWSFHGSWQVRAWLADCRRAGVVVLPPAVDWRAPLIAADSVIGDYGSLTLYATMTDAPILLTRYPHGDANPVSPGVAMALATPALSLSRRLDEQLDYAAARYPREEYARIGARLSSEPGAFNRNMRGLMYRLLGLGQPAFAPTTEPVPLPPALHEFEELGAA